jgi:4-hydroxy-tetrahydrodipicolinate reductase
MALKILLNGAQGRMGQAIQRSAIASGHEITAALDLGDAPGPAVGRCDVAVDFSFHNATLPLAEALAAAGKPLVIGTTGHTAEERAAIQRAVSPIPVVWAGNFSIGVNLLYHLTATAARILGLDYNAEVLEMHHRHKKDAPSGTAEGLIEVLKEANGLTGEAIRHGRQGLTGERPQREIGVHALRGGDVVGDHTVYFAGEGERLELTHRASDRSVFANGAIRAAEWVLERSPGIYDMRDVLEIGKPT